MVQLEESVFSFELDEALPVTYLDRNVSRPAPVPILYAIRYLCKKLESTLDILLQSEELQDLLSERDLEKNEIHECLQRIISCFNEFLMIDIRR